MHWNQDTTAVAQRHREDGLTCEQIAVLMNAPSAASVRGALGRQSRASVSPARGLGPLSPSQGATVLPFVGPRAGQRAGGHGCRVAGGSSGSPWAIACPDEHVPFEDKKALDLVAFVAEDLIQRYSPTLGMPELIKLGDFLDCLEVSKHRKDPDLRARFVDDELPAGRRVRARFDSIADWARKTITLGNHENRVRNYIIDNAPALLGLVPSVAELLEMPKNGWNVIQYGEVYRFGDLHVTHDVDKAGKYAHEHSRMNMGGSTLIGHTHRMAVTVSGTLATGPQIAAMIGWLGDKEFARYIKRPLREHWQTGFGLLRIDPGGFTHVEPIPIVDYRCVVGGKLYDLSRLARRKAA